MRSCFLVKPGSDPLNPDYYSPADFYVGAVLTVFEQRFVIIDVDLYVYRYMQENPDKFPCEVIENVRNYLFNKGLLKDDLEDQVEDNAELEKKAQRDALGKPTVTSPIPKFNTPISVKELSKPIDKLDACMAELGGSSDPEKDAQIRANILQQYEDTLKHTYKVPSHGILPVNKTCAYPVNIGDVQKEECEGVGPKKGNQQNSLNAFPTYFNFHPEPPPKLPNEICLNRIPVECKKVDIDEEHGAKEETTPDPILVHEVEKPPNACLIKTVRFCEPPDRCNRDRYDLCNFKQDGIPCDCTQYQK